jgi:hypothetical protein
MYKRKRRNIQGIKSTSFKPDSNFIKSAMEEYASRGGRISKLESTNSFYSDMMGESNLLSEPGPFLDEIHARNRQLPD